MYSMARTEHAAQGRSGLPASLLAGVLGGVGGFATFFIGSLGLVLGALLIGLTVAAYVRRGWGRAAAWVLVGAGLVRIVVLSPALLNTDPAIHYLGESYVALTVALLVLLVGTAWATVSVRNR